MKDFKVGDVVQLGAHSERGKIINILDTYSMYKVHTYCTGEIKTAGKHELVKGLPDENFVDLFDRFRHENAPTTATFTAPYVGSPIPHHVPQYTTLPQVQKEFLPRPAPPVRCSYCCRPYHCSTH